MAETRIRRKGGSQRVSPGRLFPTQMPTLPSSSGCARVASCPREKMARGTSAASTARSSELTARPHHVANVTMGVRFSCVHLRDSSRQSTSPMETDPPCFFVLFFFYPHTFDGDRLLLPFNSKGLGNVLRHVQGLRTSHSLCELSSSSRHRDCLSYEVHICTHSLFARQGLTICSMTLAPF
jgi:hypothetical protein